MATLDSTNVVNGNTIEATDVLQLYQAFGSAGGGITGLAMTGSLYGNALTATTATTATTASNINSAIVSTGTYYLSLVAGAGVNPTKIASLLEYDAATNELNVTASYATVAENAWDGLYSYIQPTGAPSTPTIVDSNTQQYLIVDTSTALGFAFSNAQDGQIVNFASIESQPSVQYNNIAVTASGVNVFGLNGGAITSGNDDTLDNISGLPNGYSFKFMFRAGNWYFIQ